MSKLNTIFICSKCDAQFPKWQGRCDECGSWGTLQEQTVNKKGKALKITGSQPVSMDMIVDGDYSRIKTGITEVDRVLGGGIVPGSVILLGGDPGIGKSTLVLQIANSVPNTIYISGEESAQQVKIRAERINANLKNLHFLPETNIEKIVATLNEKKPALAIIDSIQTMNSSDLPGSLGSTSQITNCTGQLLAIAKKENVAIVIVGHVTKDGIVAGPKTLEHLVDTVLYLENDSNNYFKILRGVKNRFGSIGEIGVFEMTTGGMREITNPSEIFFSDTESPASGTITTAVMEGSRPFLVEVQALVTKTTFGYPQRRSTGFDLNRLQMLIAVMAKSTKINLGNQDVYLNIAGGLKVKDTAVDVAVALAIASAYFDVPINKHTLAFGEIGLSGEIRTVSQSDARVKEAVKLNFSRIIAPKSAGKNKNVVAVENISEAVKIINQKM